MKKNRHDRVYNIIANIIMILVLIITIYPLYFILIASVSNPDLTYAGKVWIIPKGFNLNGYKILIADGRTWIGYKNTIIYTVLGTSINLLFTLPAAYALSRKQFKARGFINIFILFTMFFSGGMIPTYLVVKNLHMVDTIWAVLIPNAVSVWNLIIARTYFAENIPEELADSAFIDGCSHVRFFISIVLPLSKVLIVVIALFYGVNHWNGFFQALIYLNDKNKFPLQLFLREILIQQQSLAIDPSLVEGIRYTANLVKYAIIIVAAAPIIIIYIFLQNFFVKGVMIGSLKG